MIIVCLESRVGEKDDRDALLLFLRRVVRCEKILVPKPSTHEVELEGPGMKRANFFSKTGIGIIRRIALAILHFRKDRFALHKIAMEDPEFAHSVEATLHENPGLCRTAAVQIAAALAFGFRSQADIEYAATLSCDDRLLALIETAKVHGVHLAEAKSILRVA